MQHDHVIGQWVLVLEDLVTLRALEEGGGGVHRLHVAHTVAPAWEGFKAEQAAPGAPTVTGVNLDQVGVYIAWNESRALNMDFNILKYVLEKYLGYLIIWYLYKKNYE